ncbi:MAG TPA: succinate dehydrogenase iron-sulfur subunit [Chloroflexota bacterium]|nr:succinate dehydrogenase iron-sulfur subunit [Chloroflexota bacterium]
MTRAAAPGETVELRVRRFDPTTDRRPYWARYEVAVRPKMSVLDALFAVLEQQDGTLGFRYSCRAAMCGSCAMVIDGREALACATRLARLGRRITVEPLRQLPIVKDLVTDLEPFWAKWAVVTPYFVGGRYREPAVIPPESGRREIIDAQLDCITCAACYSACPIVASNPRYLGPAALNRAYNLIADERDTAAAQRLAAVCGEDGAFSCRNAFNCVEVCPQGIDPQRSILRLRQRALVGA